MSAFDIEVDILLSIMFAVSYKYSTTTTQIFYIILSTRIIAIDEEFTLCNNIPGTTRLTEMITSKFESVTYLALSKNLCMYNGVCSCPIIQNGNQASVTRLKSF